MNRGILLVWLAALTLIPGRFALGEIYRWVDDRGGIHYSDRADGAAAAEPVQVFDSDGGKGLEGEAVPASGSGGSQPQRSRPGAPLITSSDYRIEVKASQRGELVTFSGRVGDGPPCARLRLTFRARSDDGLTATASTAIENAGAFGSRLIETTDRVAVARNALRRNWVVSEIAARCD